MVKNYYAGNLMSEALEKLIDKKLQKLEKYAEDIVVDVYLSLENKNHITKMILNSKSKNYINLVAEAKSDDMYKNIDICVDALKLQITKEKPMKKHSKHSKEKVRFEEI